MQVADRFHLIVNLSAAMERVLEEHSRELVLAPAAGTSQPLPDLPAVPASAHQGLEMTVGQQRRQRRLERYQQVVEPYQKGYSKKAISRELGIECKTIRRWLRSGQFPERKPPRGRRQKVAAFDEYLQQRWSEGCHNATRLFQEIRAHGL